MPTEQEAHQIITNLVIRSANQIAEGKSKAEIVALLKKEGCPSDLATSVKCK